MLYSGGSQNEKEEKVSSANSNLDPTGVRYCPSGEGRGGQAQQCPLMNGEGREKIYPRKQRIP